ncbi:MAG: hypothetical protein HPY85_14475 [Anaerolineae bacterium]|nr:hypothetical protein [Anaerolineae bacterium]
MDFTQIMQRYVRLKEKYNRGEIDADAFEEQVNRMVYKDNLGRYWQIGVESGKWYYYDGEKWVQDDLLEDDADTTQPEDDVTPAEAEAPAFSVENFFTSDEESKSPSTQEAFDLAFEEELAEQFADSSDSQQFKLFNEEDIFAGLLGKEPVDEDDLMAPAEEVEGLAEHLMATQPVSIENWMGEGEANSGYDEDDQDIGFIFDDGEGGETIQTRVAEFTDEDLAALLFDDSGESEGDSEDDFDDFRAQPYEREVVTGELSIKADPVSEDEVQELFDLAAEETATGEHETQPGLPMQPQASDLDELELPNGVGFEIIENEDDLAELPWDVDEDLLSGTQPVSALDEAEEGDEPNLFDLPQLEPLPNHQDEPMLETMQSVKPVDERPQKKGRKQWVVAVIAVLAGLILIGSLLAAGYFLIFKNGPGFSPLAQADNRADIGDWDLMDDFSNPDSGWPTLGDYSVGVSAYNAGFYYVYAIAPEPPTVSVLDKAVYSDVILQVDTTQIELDGGTNSTYGVMCRVQDNGDGYAFRITNSGLYVIERYISGVFQPINEWKYAQGIKAGKDINKNRIEMHCEGNQLTLIVNGQVLDVAVDDMFSNGRIAFVAQTGSIEVDTEVHYDDLYLRVP